jgi:hypothetical protein
MKQILYLILTALILAGCTSSTTTSEDNDSGTFDTSAVTTNPMITTAETTTVTTGQYICYLCKSDSSFEKNIHGYDVSFQCPIMRCECSIDKGFMYLIEKAVKLFVDLDNNYDNAIEQVDFILLESEDALQTRHFWSARFKHEGNIKSIAVNDFGSYADTFRIHPDGRISITFLVTFSHEDGGWVTVLFETKNDEWVIVDLYDTWSIGG